jgi:hypothetical protein
MRTKNKKVKIYHSSLHVKQGEIVKYFLIISEIVDSEVLCSYAVELPLWTRWHRFEEYEYYHPMQN